MTLALRSTQLTVRSYVSGTLNKMVMWEKKSAADPCYTTPTLPSTSPLDRDRRTSETVGRIFQR